MLALSVLLSSGGACAQGLDIDALWNFREPAQTEARFRAALATARGDDAVILQTQIARTHGLRRDFETSRRILAALRPAIDTAGPEARTRFQLEWGRTWASGTHRPDDLTAEAKAQARSAYEQALAIARRARLDRLAIDALHMFAFVDTAPAEQLRWAQEALAVVQASTQPDARRWEASIRNNLGVALNELGRHAEALTEFEQALRLREAGGNAWSIHVARWLVARTLRQMGRLDEALAIQHRLEGERAAAGEPDTHVFEELQALYRLKADDAQADRYRALARAAAKP
jgi:tetratricopeptide (TPR) repeat protein